MFKLFKAKEVSTELAAPITGQFVPLDQVADPVFAQKMAGDGFGVQPTSDTVYSPVSGTITNIFKTKHALGIKTDSGLEILVHIGLDTVELAGKPFEILVEEGQSVSTTTQLAKVDFEMIRESQKAETVLVLVTNMDRVKTLTFETSADVTVNAAETVETVITQ